MGEQPRLRGVVKWFNATKGFGFITPEAGSGTQEDLFVHQTNINSEGFRSLREGETVEFEVETSPDGRQKAVNISGPGGAAPQGAPPRTYRTAGAGPYAGRGPGGPGGRGGRGGRGFYGYPVMPPYYAMGYYFPPGDYDPTAGRGRGRGGRGGRAPQAYYGMPPVAQQGQVAAEPSGLQVVVHNLPWTCQWQQLKDIFKEWRVDRADIVYDSWGRSRGFGTVRFFSKADAESSCNKMNNTQVEGRTISVRIDRFA